MDFIDKTTLEKLAAEKSVRGAVVRKAMDRYAQAEEGQKPVVEAALKMLLDRFGIEPEATP